MKHTPTSLRSACSKLAVFAVSVLALHGAAQAQIISYNIRSGTTPNNSVVAQPFGIAAESTVVSNWNQSAAMQSNVANLIDSNGNVTSVTANAFNPGGTQFWGAGYAFTPWNFGVAMFPSTANAASITFSNLNAAFPNGYYALVYVNGVTTTTTAQVTDGSTTYFFRPSNPATVTPLLITTVLNPGPGNFTAGNYARFGSALAALTSDSITFSIPVGSIDAGNAGIGGVQLVAVPEPSAFAALGGLGALGFAALRRRRS